MNIIEFNNVTKNIYNFSLKPINIVLRKGEILGIVGRSGSGKTTLAKLITNFYKPKTGSISVFGLNSVQDSKAIKYNLSVIPQSNWFNDSMRPISFLRNTLRSRNSKNYDEIDYLLDYFDVKLTRKIGDMTPTDKRKLSIINGLISNSDLIVVDEPETIIDIKTRLKLYDILEEKNRAGASVLILCSNLKEAQSICDNIYYLHNGEVIEEEDQSNKLSNDKLLKFYDNNVNRDVYDKIGAKLVKSGNETVYYYNGPLDILSEAIYKTGLIDYTVEDSTLSEKLTILEKEIALRRDGIVEDPPQVKPIKPEVIIENKSRNTTKGEYTSDTIVQKREDIDSALQNSNQKDNSNIEKENKVETISENVRIIEVTEEESKDDIN